MDQHYAWDVGVWEGTNDASASLLDDPNPPFNVAHVLCCRGGIEGSMLDIIPHLLKLIVHEDGVDLEPCTCVNVHNMMK